MTGPDPLDRLAWPVRTDRLTIRRGTPADLDATWAFRRLPAVHEWLTTGFTDLAAYREHFLDPARLAHLLIPELDGDVVGDLMLRVVDAWAQAEVRDRARGVQAELGWAFDPAHHGRGLATEAVEALLEVCFGRLGLHRVVAYCFADNEPSWRLMERVGMRRETHTVQESLHRTRGWVDGMSYALLAEEWLQD